MHPRSVQDCGEVTGMEDDWLDAGADDAAERRLWAVEHRKIQKDMVTVRSGGNEG